MTTQTKYVDREVIKFLAYKNWRGVPLPNLVCEFQRAQDNIDDLECAKQTDLTEAIPHIIPFVPSDFEGTPAEYIDLHICHEQCVIESILKEMKRREDIHYDNSANPDRNIIATIKARVSIADVLDWYTEVFTHKSKWTYRCTLHGEDRHPSGVIYPDEQRSWCFVCNRGGDIFDVVKLFERLELSQAIAKLARYIGIDTKPITRTGQKAGGVSLEVRG